MTLINRLLKDFLAWCAIVLGVLANITPLHVLTFLGLEQKTTRLEGTILALLLLIARAVDLRKAKTTPT